MSLPAPRPLSVSKSSSPAAARAAAQDAQIAQLVEQNRALEESVSQLRDQLSAEEARGIDAVNQIRERWKVESKEWRDGCDSIQARHRLAHLQTRVALEHERGFRLEDREALIREKTATLLRDYKITLFQARETDLVDQVAVLEEETQLQREEMANMLTRHEAEIARMSVELTHAEARQQENVEQVGNVVGERKALKAELATFQASLSSSAKQIERLNLQIENLHTHNSSLSAHNGELQHQVDKWQSLEGKGEKEAESLRKRRIELEVRVKELEVNLKESRAMGKKVTKLEVFKYSLRGLPLPSTLSGFTPGDSGTS
ncbi:hypothetical protein JB92DRAFT_2894757 [Gautieria morchelliformis]|nr:hypothetical protein JB92DRAFT_2894757 [Gautieria morchelliformis]